MIKRYNYMSDRKLLILYGLIFIGFAALIYLVPYSHDDWAWGCEVGLERLRTNFEAYNGRYMGNYMILLLTRSELLRVLVIAFRHFFCVFYLLLFFRGGQLSLLFFQRHWFF